MPRDWRETFKDTHPELEGQPLVEDLDPEGLCDTRPYAVEAGVSYWVSAGSHSEAVRLVEEIEEDPFEEAVTVEEVPLPECNRLAFRDDTERETIYRRMGAEYLRDRSPRVLACSEW